CRPRTRSLAVTAARRGAPPLATAWSGTRSWRSCARPLRLSSTSVAAPAASPCASPSSDIRSPSSTRARTPWPRWPVAPRRVGSATWSPGSRETWPASSTWWPRAAPTSCCATVCWGSWTIPPRHSPRSPAHCVRAEPSVFWSASVMPLSSPAPCPATSSRPRSCWNTRTKEPRQQRRPAGSPRTRSWRCSTSRVSTPRPSTRSGSSPISCRAPWSTSSQALRRRSSSWSVPWPSGPSTSLLPRSCTCSPLAVP
ncbi:MAG: Ubiquinone biosynthesis SAM-dependent O-methyltransferase, partial [uncultured Nocardioidaceae bacterium]